MRDRRSSDENLPFAELLERFRHGLTPSDCPTHLVPGFQNAQLILTSSGTGPTRGILFCRVLLLSALTRFTPRCAISAPLRARLPMCTIRLRGKSRVARNLHASLRQDRKIGVQSISTKRAALIRTVNKRCGCRAERRCVTISWRRNLLSDWRSYVCRWSRYEHKLHPAHRQHPEIYR